MTRCRFGWYERGRVIRHVFGRQRHEIPEDEPSAPALLRRGPQGIRIVEAEISGSTWYGRLTPKKDGMTEGSVLLFERPDDQGE